MFANTNGTDANTLQIACFRESVSAPGIFFLPFPTRACFCFHLTKQFGVPSRRVYEFGLFFALS